jgi:methionyl-tRNA synthetase
MDKLQFDLGLAAMWRAVQAANRYVEEKKPWALAKEGSDAALGDCLRVLLEVLRVCSVLCVPFMPEKSAEMRAQLALETDAAALSLQEAERPGAADWTTVGKPTPLFPKLETPPSD